VGVYSQDLAVLKNAKVPAILIEVGNILDPDDERTINTTEFRQKFATVISKSLKDFFGRQTQLP